jgi:hypothetical protein
MSLTTFVPDESFEQYRERFTEHFVMERTDEGVLEVRMHTNGGEAVWSAELHRAIGQVFEAIGSDRDNELLIFTGTGEHWLQDVDAPSFAAIEDDEEVFKRKSFDMWYRDGLRLLENLIWDIDIPSIAVVNGPGFHTEFALLCDLTLCAEDTYFIEPHLHIGLAPGDALVRDLWAHADRGVVADSFTARVEPHGTVMLKITAQSYVAATVPDPAAPSAPPADAPVADPNFRYPYLSDLAATFAENALGPIELNISNGEGGAGDGRAITLGDRHYGKGLGVHAPSDVRYDLGGTCTAFAADIGLDAEVGQNGTAVFQVWADGALIYDSGALHGDMAPVPVYLDIPGVHELRLVVAPVDWVTDYAHADWADARVACRISSVDG